MAVLDVSIVFYGKGKGKGNVEFERKGSRKKDGRASGN
jgi:hypothetical protein